MNESFLLLQIEGPFEFNEDKKSCFSASSVTIEELEMMERRHYLYLSMGIFLLLSNGINGQENMDNAPEIEVINQLTNTVNELKAQFQDFQVRIRIHI